MWLHVVRSAQYENQVELHPNQLLCYGVSNGKIRGRVKKLFLQ